MVTRTAVGSDDDGGKRKQRAAHLRWIPIAEMRVSPKSQREFRKSHAEEYAADFDLEALGYPVVSMRDGHYWIVDGQHRIEALKMIGWGDQSIQCECYEGLAEADEADLFLRRDTRRAIRPFDKFRIALTAGREVETDIERTVAAQGLKISQDSAEGSIAAIAALRRVAALGGPAVLGRDLRILRDSFAGDSSAFHAELISGVGRVCQRYNGALDDRVAVERLSALRGGAAALVRKANSYKEKTGRPKDDCIAAAVVDVINAGRGGKKLDGWWQ